MGRSVIEWTADYEKEKNAAAVKACFDKGYIRNFEIDYVDAKGAVTPIELNATCLEVGGKTHTLTICRDISERRKIENELQNLASIVRHSSDLINLAAGDGKKRAQYHGYCSGSPDRACQNGTLARAPERCCLGR
jgi:PAS domain-containing protein